MTACKDWASQNCAVLIFVKVFFYSFYEIRLLIYCWRRPASLEGILLIHGRYVFSRILRSRNVSRMSSRKPRISGKVTKDYRLAIDMMKFRYSHIFILCVSSMLHVLSWKLYRILKVSKSPHWNENRTGAGLVAQHTDESILLSTLLQLCFKLNSPFKVPPDCNSLNCCSMKERSKNSEKISHIKFIKICISTYSSTVENFLNAIKTNFYPFQNFARCQRSRYR